MDASKLTSTEFIVIFAAGMFGLAFLLFAYDWIIEKRKKRRGGRK